MITPNTMFNIKNRSSSVVVYRIPETGKRREFQPGETQRVSFEELQQLTYQPGGRVMLEEFLQIIDNEPAQDLNIHREAEYNMSENQVRDLLLTGSLDAFLDALDFAPLGIIDLIKVFAVQLPLTDLNKRRALKEKTGFDVDTALRHIEEEKAADAPAAQSTTTRERRVKPADTTTPGRRTNVDYSVETPQYKVVDKPEYKIINSEPPKDSEM